ncbi:MAG: exodeoxyribonuclease VII small subunit [Bacteroidetes bacterium GWE2_39_28]|jgi:exodeoxyribonuclease VII small subunit|nr:MAG: exodeoxyribonuclease VII small subunit [Bacteroidetes bacterium GWE2_39_28]OFY12643.1 MAG: exodeoxyribonuclease VII small subunit [Bacteroidetes bacterium GWF2_39_10]OFZ06738.1 MAG: exodeoxyribonuclease VII small subunit [Bacteroidetes bacterium RIFOXYB2_FULL_39_7]OFZ09639.1 MAG: exodeoxyribonuclease VII small subunit [Bacteroidetes bacterium RIFOXYC2_FULL_39_11]HCT94643.1 exodeoxyribonuclease VII small subunit [Rikenellaceae bacterium]
MNNIKNLTYKEALKQLEDLVNRIESPEADITNLAEDVKRAISLVKHCREQIKGFGQELDKIIEQ